MAKEPYKSDPEIMKANYDRIKRDRRFNILDKTISWCIMLTPLFIIFMLLMTCTSCSTVHTIPVIDEDGVRWTTTDTRQVIAKDKDSYNYLIALNDGSTYYCTFGEYSLIQIGDYLELNKRGTKIINIHKKP